MPNELPTPNIRLLATASMLLLSGCAVHLPPAPASDPADPHAAEAATAPWRPRLLATPRTFVSPHADDREEKAKQMDVSEVKAKAMKPGMIDSSRLTHEPSGTPAQKPSADRRGETFFTCPMHPEIHEAGPGQCPICGMTLVRKTSAPEGAKP